ncbi:MAG: hypothetical protein JOZ02_05050 [Acidobacteria bacterium]|nr:hypothetical protein [Acidobacteriota bacterium]
MSRDFGARAVRAALKRVERAAGKGQRHCPWCRLHYRHWWPDPKFPRPRPEDLVSYRCELCGTEMLFNFSNRSEEERELLRLSHSFSMEDAYRNPAAVALEAWLSMHPKRRDARAPRKLSAEADGRDPGARALAKLRAEEERLVGRKREGLIARYGDATTNVKGIIAAVQNRERERWQVHCAIRGLPELVDEQSDYLICAELEKIIWAQVRPETASAIEGLEQRIGELVEAERARARAEEEEAQRRREEEEAERLKREAREAAERSLKESEERPRRVKPRYGEPEPDDPERGMHVFDFEAYERQRAGGTGHAGRVRRHLRRE